MWPNMAYLYDVVRFFSREGRGFTCTIIASRLSTSAVEKATYINGVFSFGKVVENGLSGGSGKVDIAEDSTIVKSK